MYLKDKPSGWSKLTTPPYVWFCVKLKPSCRFHTLVQATVAITELYLYLIKQTISELSRKLFFFVFLPRLTTTKKNGEEGCQCNCTASRSVPKTDRWVLFHPGWSCSWSNIVFSVHLMFWHWSETDWQKSSHYFVWFHHFKYICEALLRILPINNAFVMWGDLRLDAKNELIY